MDNGKTMLSFQAPTALRDRLYAEARERHSSASALIREALRAHLSGVGDPKPEAAAAREGAAASGTRGPA